MSILSFIGKLLFFCPFSKDVFVVVCCPVDLSVSDKVYVDDQSRTTGDYYLYIPFRMFRFLDGSKVRFSCNVIVCQHDCPWVSHHR
ncbi:ZP domain-containing protein [Nephila pilipes]|uniref:ZP domain-containing protein n=1 Tax=Nephila pilipes TaxID=299642 RepID=A0A8X6QBZ5_NEPPI|nr:ZP domain-containing protein [Nephila pilipes]